MSNGAERAEIEALTLYYALGTDAIGRGEVEEGRRLYRLAFTEDAEIAASYPGSDPEVAPDITARGPDGWVEVVENLFTARGYTATQHLIGTVMVEVQGNTARMSTYLSATHVLDPGRSLDVAQGTYVDRVVRTPAGWRIARRTVRLISFVRLQSPPTAR